MLITHRDAVNDVFEFDAAADFRHDRGGEGVPLREALAARDLLAGFDLHDRAERRFEALPLAPFRIVDRNDHVARHNHQIAIARRHGIAVLKPNDPVIRRVIGRLLGHLRGAANVEGAHGELRARLADRLRRNDPDRFANIDARAARQIPTIASPANPNFGLASQHGANFNSHDPRFQNLGDHVFVEIGPGRRNDRPGRMIADVFGQGPAQDPRAQIHDDFGAVEHRADFNAAIGPAIVLQDDAILRNIDEAARQIAGIGGFQRRVRQPFAGAVRRVEIFENRQTFFEVRDDRRLDNVARGLRHKPAHPGQLLHLVFRAARARMGHHVNRIGLARPARRHVCARFGSLLHHRVGDFVGAGRPSVDDFVIFLALGQQAIAILPLKLRDLFARLFDEVDFARRHHHVVFAERNAGLAGFAETQPHDAVAEDHRRLLTAEPIDRVDHIADFFLGHQFGDQLGVNFRVLRQQFGDL